MASNEELADAQRDWWKLEEEHPEACQIATDFLLARRMLGYSNMAKIMAGLAEHADSV